MLLLNIFLFLLLTRGRHKKILYALAFSLLPAWPRRLSCQPHGRPGPQRQRRGQRGELRLRSGPGEDNTVLFKVNPGLEVRSSTAAATGSRSRLPRIAGWIEKKRLVLI